MTGPYGDTNLLEHLLQRSRREADPFEDPAYLAYLEEMERQCGRDVVFGEDGASCSRDADHPEKTHRGPSPFGEGFVEWEGGGSCAGDPLPVRNVRFVA